jgi:hypothetical protein
MIKEIKKAVRYSTWSDTTPENCPKTANVTNRQAKSERKSANIKGSDVNTDWKTDRFASLVAAAFDLEFARQYSLRSSAALRSTAFRR